MDGRVITGGKEQAARQRYSNTCKARVWCWWLILVNLLVTADIPESDLTCQMMKTENTIPCYLLSYPRYR